MAPAMPNPPIISAQVEGSGTAIEPASPSYSKAFVSDANRMLVVRVRDAQINQKCEELVAGHHARALANIF